MKAIAALLVVCGVEVAAAADGKDDVVLRAMRDEIGRSQSLKVVNLESPYYVEYAIEEMTTFSASATLGGLVHANLGRVRLPRVAVRVGDYQFDNTNYVGSAYTYGSNYDVDRMPLDDNYELLRRFLWLATDRAYKSALESIARKRAALKNVSVGQQPADFAKAPPFTRFDELRRQPLDEEAWKQRVRALSAVFARYPQLRTSSVELEAIENLNYMVTSEGAEIRVPERSIYLRARLSGQAPDGMILRDWVTFQSGDFQRFPSQGEIERALTRSADHVTAMMAAPRGEVYNGPIVFEREAAAQLFAQVLGKNFALTRRPVTEPGRPGVFPASELEGRFGARILPEWMDVVDDSTQAEWRGAPLFGHYTVDLEGLPPQPVTLVDKGVLKNFLMTRQPMRGRSGSNGHARLPGSFGAYAASFGNLFIRVRETVSFAGLSQKMMEICNLRNKPYGIVIRKLDFPSSASFEEVRRLLSGSAQSGGPARPVSIPLLAYRVYTDGHEELVRGLRFRGLNTQSLKDILAASDELTVFDFLDSPAPMALMGAGGFLSEATVVAPSVLVDDLDLEPMEEEFPKMPVVPPPS